MINSGLTLLPNKNLIKNIGFGEEATHTKIRRKNYNPIFDKNLKDYFKIIKHPKFVLRDKEADKYTEENYLSGPNIFSILFIRRFLNVIFLKPQKFFSLIRRYTA